MFRPPPPLSEDSLKAGLKHGAPAILTEKFSPFIPVSGLSLAEIGWELGVTEKTARHYLDLLAGAYMVRVLPPWFENISKRQVKSPKIYLRDSGIFHALLNLKSAAEMRAHPKVV